MPPGRPSLRSTRITRRQKRVKNTRQTNTRTQSTYGNNKLRKPTPGMPGASIGQGRGRLGGSVRRAQPKQHTQSKIRGVKYTNYRINNRNPMDD